MPIQDLSGMRFGRWTAIDGFVVNRKTFWNCLCDCGSQKAVAASSLKTGDSKSCGCLNIESIKRRSRTHGMSKTTTYICWSSVIARCTRANADPLGLYFARGITVCDRWRNSFENFLEDMGERPGPEYSIDRIDPRGNYEPSNCRWATKKLQARNRRTSKTITHNGRTLTIAEWAEVSGLKMQTLWKRIHDGIPFDVAISAPAKQGQKGLRAGYAKQ